MDEYFAIHEARYERILAEVDHIGTKKKILDVGCFPYHIGAMLEKKGHDVWGIASAHEPIQNKQIKICNIETDTFPFKEHTFDIVIFTEVLEHLPQSPLKALREMHRVTKKGGTLVITTPNATRLINRLKMLFGYNTAYPLSHVLTNDVPYHRHNREYTLQEAVTLVAAAGWHVQKRAHINAYPPTRTRTKQDALYVQWIKWVYFLGTSLLPPLRDTLLLIASK